MKTSDNMADLSKKLIVTRKKNFIRRNILHVKHSYPIEPKQRFVDTRYGDTHDLRSSGLLPIYVYKKGYGNVPKFIATKPAVDVKTEIIGCRDFGEEEISSISSCQYIDQEERKKLLDLKIVYSTWKQGMKQKWEEMMKRYQSLPFLTDTLPKVQKKAQMERELQQLEKDIAVIEQHPHIYVYVNDA